MPPSRASTSTRHTRATRSNTASAHAHAGGIPSASTLIVDEGPEQGQETERETSHPPAQVARRRTTTRSGNSRHNRQASRGPLTSAPTTIKQLSKTESEIIEISSDDEEVPLAAQQLVGDLRKQLKKLKEEVTKFKQECKKKEQENAKLKSIIALQPPKDGIYIDTGDLEDATNCEICSTPMWRPVILTDCGHTFCQPCLLDWFETCLNKYRATHPNQPIDPRSQIFSSLLVNSAVLPPHLQQMIQPYEDSCPQYSCPLCRARVRRSPTENFAIKKVINSISNAHEKQISPTGKLKTPGLRALSNGNGNHFSRYFPY